MKLTQDAVTRLKAAAAAGDPETYYSILSENGHSYGVLGVAAATNGGSGKDNILRGYLTERDFAPAPRSIAACPTPPNAAAHRSTGRCWQVVVSSVADAESEASVVYHRGAVQGPQHSALLP